MTHITNLLAIVFTFSVLVGAMGDGLYDDGKKLAGKWMQHVELATYLFLFLFMNDPIKFTDGLTALACYVGIRFALFDYVYNGIRGLPLGYHGKTSFYGRALNWFKGTKAAKIFVPDHTLFMLKLMALVASIAKLITL